VGTSPCSSGSFTCFIQASSRADSSATRSAFSGLDPMSSRMSTTMDSVWFTMPIRQENGVLYDWNPAHNIYSRIIGRRSPQMAIATRLLSAHLSEARAGKSNRRCSGVRSTPVRTRNNSALFSSALCNQDLCGCGHSLAPGSLDRHRKESISHNIDSHQHHTTTHMAPDENYLAAALICASVRT
jgi:hypothetical protein